jgi:hypothetical protein
MSSEYSVKQGVNGGAVIAAYFVFLIPALILRGWLVSNTLRWFVEPIYPVIPSLGIIHAAGIAMAIAALIPSSTPRPAEGDTTGMQIANMLDRIIMPSLIALGAAWLLHLWM